MPVILGILFAIFLALLTPDTWARSPESPVGGWYGLKKGFRGRFANYVPPVMELLSLASYT